MRVTLLALLLVARTAAAALAQSYSSPAPVPATTSAPALRAAAERREISERFTIGLAAQARGAWKASAAEFERILALHPAEPQGSTAHYDLAIAQANLGLNDEAARNLREALTLDPGFLAAMANLISVDLARGDTGEARTIANRYLALDPQSARALYSRGIVALQSGDDRTAREDFGKLLRANPAYAVAHYDLALAEERLQHYDAAIRELQSALMLAPTYARAALALGAVLLRQGHRSQAREAFARAERDAGADPALRNIAAAMLQSI
jgi:tetratricopeptide (TPR) repeat protein